MVKFLFWVLAGYIIFRYLRSLLAGGKKPPVVKTDPKNKDDDFQQKHSTSIEDADFEDVD